MRKFLSVVFLFALTACGTEPAIDMSTVELKGQPIFGGSEPNDSRFDAVVGLYIQEGGSTYICSGTLIAPDVVLSAAHCFASARGKKVIVSSPNDVQVFFGADLGSIAVAVADVHVHDGYNPRGYGVNDLTLLRLAAPAGVAPIATLPGSMGNLETVGTPVFFAGYGLTETDTIGHKLWVDGSLSDVTTTGLRNEQDNETGTCGGDSGGPLFYDFGGTWYVGGTTSWGDSACTDYGWSMRVSAYENWISDYVSGAAPDCISDAECDDGDSCTDDSCDAGACTSIDNGTCGGCLPKKSTCSIDTDCCTGRCHRGVCR